MVPRTRAAPAGSEAGYASITVKILVIADLPPDPDSGSAGTVYHSSRSLEDLGHEVTDVWRDEIPWRIRHGNLHILLERPRAYRNLMLQNLRVSAYDVVQVSHAQAFLAAKTHRRLGGEGVFVSRTHGLEPDAADAVRLWQRKLAYPQRDLLRRAFSRLQDALVRRHLKLASIYSDGFVVGSSESCRSLVEHCGMDPTRVTVIPHGIPDAYALSPPPAMSSQRLKRVLYVGQFAFIKAPSVLGATFSALCRACPDVEMTWVCAPQHHAEARGLLDDAARDQVRFLGWMSQGELMRVYDTHGVFLFPSYFEGFGEAFHEAMARGLCVIASEVGGMRDVIRNGHTGYLCAPGDVDAFVAATRRLMVDPRSAAKISERAAEVASRNTWRAWATSASEFYDRLLAMRCSG